MLNGNGGISISGWMVVDRLVERPPQPAQLERHEAGGGAGIGDADLRRLTTGGWVHPCGQGPAAGGQHGDQQHAGYEHSTKHPGSVGPGIAPTQPPIRMRAAMTNGQTRQRQARTFDLARSLEPRELSARNIPAGGTRSAVRPATKGHAQTFHGAATPKPRHLAKRAYKSGTFEKFGRNGPMSTYSDLPADDPVARLLAEIACTRPLRPMAAPISSRPSSPAPAASRMTRSPTAWRSSSATSW